MRRLLVTGLAVLALPSAAEAATRPIQAYDRPTGFLPVWTPSDISAQVGDTVRWQFEQPGNVWAAGYSHDVMLTPPGGPEAQVGTSVGNTFLERPVDTLGTYQFRCSIHTDTMRGTINVVAGDAGPVVDPGRPWESPTPPTEPGPPPATNTTTAPTVFEEGDTKRPTLALQRVSTKARKATVRVKVSEAGTLHLRVLSGSKTVASARAKVKKAGTANASIRLPARRGTYRLAVWAADAAGLESSWRYKTVKVR